MRRNLAAPAGVFLRFARHWPDQTQPGYIVVPRSRLEDLFQFAGRLQKKHGLQLACFGHAGDGTFMSM